MDELRADRWEALLAELDRQGGITDAEARVLLQLFPSDETDCYGFAWTLMHLVESAPGWPLLAELESPDPWMRCLSERARRGT